MRTLLCAAGTALLTLASGCGTLEPHHEHAIADAWRAGPQARTVLLAPMNATTGIAEELQPGAEDTYALIREHLEEHGIAVREVDSLYRFRDAWTRSFAGVELTPEEHDVPPAAIAQLFAALGDDENFEALVLPDLETRPARVNGTAARWDGVSRKLVDERTGGWPWRGNVAALSLRVRVYDANGERVFDGYGGLDMIFKVSMENRLALVEEPLADLDHLRQGVRTAFDPLLPLDE